MLERVSKLIKKFMHTLHFNVTGMHCDSCVKLITMRIKRISGTTEFFVTKDGKAQLSADRDVSIEEVKNALRDMEYIVTAA